MNESLYFGDGRNNVAFFIGKIRLRNPIERVAFLATARGFETHKVCHNNNQSTLPPLPPNRFFYHPDSGWSRDQPQPGSFSQRQREAEKREPGNEVVNVLQHHADVIVYIFAHLHTALRTEGNMLDMN